MYVQNTAATLLTWILAKAKQKRLSREAVSSKERREKPPQPKATKEEIGRVYGGMHCYNGDLEKFKTELDKENQDGQGTGSVVRIVR